MTNCPNCGGEIDLSANKCAYCRTPYYDLSCIPLHKPFLLRLNVGTDEKPQFIIQKVYTYGVNMTLTNESVSLTTLSDKRLYVSRSPEVEYEISFVGMGNFLTELQTDSVTDKYVGGKKKGGEG